MRTHPILGLPPTPMALALLACAERPEVRDAPAVSAPPPVIAAVALDSEPVILVSSL